MGFGQKKRGRERKVLNFKREISVVLKGGRSKKKGEGLSFIAKKECREFAFSFWVYCLCGSRGLAVSLLICFQLWRASSVHFVFQGGMLSL